MFPGLNGYNADDKVSCSKKQHSASGQSHTSKSKFLLLFVDFFQNELFQKILSGILSDSHSLAT